ncbi:MAG: hypothetical protein R3F39_12765 [Myxococcota bacterium]
MLSNPVDVARARRLLQARGYRVATRHDAWWDCLVTGHGERWLGHGVDEDAAVLDALRALAPSRAAWDAVFEQATAAPTRGDGVAATAEPEAASARGGVAGVRAGLDAAPPPDAEANPAPAVEAEAEPAPPEPDDALPPRAAAPGAASPPPAAPEVVQPAGALPTAEEIDEAVDELTMLERRILDAQPEVALMTAELQRLHFLTWICRARAVQFRLSDDLRVERAAGSIARILGILGKRWWPGNVSALQMRATPLDAGAELGLPGGGHLHDWIEAADRAEEQLAARLDSLGDGRHDDYGWADQGALAPAPNDIAGLMRESVATLERVLGPLDRAPAREARARVQADGAAVVAELLRVARALRWLRGHAPDPEEWAAAFGRLRWISSQLRGDPAAALREVLESEFRPPMSWAQALGQDPGRKRMRRRRRDTLSGVTGLRDVGDDALIAWLLEAFELGTEMPNPRLAGLLYPVRDRIGALELDALPDSNRRVRKRLADLKKRLQVIGSDEAESIIRSVEREAAEDGPAESESQKRQAPPEEKVNAIDLLAERVRRQTRGRKALFVSNREDPELKARLETLLDLELTWSVIDPRRIQAKRDAVVQGSFDFVLSATGFQGHNVDAALYRAARSAGIPYVRVNRGRPVTCVRSLARELGLEAAKEAA